MTNTILDHRQLIASLSDEQRTALTQKSDLHGVLHLFSHIIAIGLTSVWIVNAWVGWQAILVIHGIMLVFLFTLLHETAHLTAFKTKNLNTVIGWVCALIVILPPNWFRYFHLAHHRHTHNPEKDPELEGKKPDTFLEFAWVTSGLPIWWFQINAIFQNAMTNPEYDYVPEAGAKKVEQEARFILGFYSFLLVASLVYSSAFLLWIWIIPVLLGQPFLRLYLMAEHGRCPNVTNMLENTRTTYTTGIVRWLAWNMPYHTEHHAYPTVPFHQLPKFHEVAKTHLRVTENGYTQFHKKTIQILSDNREQA